MGKEQRDAQFSGFAKLLLKELLDDVLAEYGLGVDRNVYTDLNYDLAICEQIIARRAYDLVCHAVTNLDNDVAWRMGKGYTVIQIVEDDVPDMEYLQSFRTPQDIAQNEEETG